MGFKLQKYRLNQKQFENYLQFQFLLICALTSFYMANKPLKERSDYLPVLKWEHQQLTGISPSFWIQIEKFG